MDSRLCDFLEKGKEKELSNILFLTTGGKSICMQVENESLSARGTEEAGESCTRKPTEVMAQEILCEYKTCKELPEARVTEITR